MNLYITKIALAIAVFVFATPVFAFTPYEVEKIPNVLFGTADGVDLYLDVIKPIDATSEYPTLIWIHGGSWVSGDRNYEPGSNPFIVASYGYVVVPVDYRLTPTGVLPEQIHDVRGAVRYMRANAETYSVNPDRIGVVGTSVGGAIATITTLTNDDSFYHGEVGGNLDQSNEVSAGLNLFGSLDIANLSELATSKLSKLSQALGCTFVLDSDCADELQIVDVNYIANSGDAELLTIHGTADTSIPYTHSVNMTADIVAQGGNAKLIPAPGYDHEDTFLPLYIKRVIRFFNQYL